MSKSLYQFIDTPSLLIDYDIMLANLKFMQSKADKYKVKLRPHTKTHKMPELARLQMELGASGITVAKVGEAEVMAKNGINDIFIANEIVGRAKLKRLKELNETAEVSVGVDNFYQVDQLAEAFKNAKKPVSVLIELEVGENRSGAITDGQLTSLAKYIAGKEQVKLKGIFSHEGHTYKAKDSKECLRLARESQEKTLRAANLLRGLGMNMETVSIGATPSLMQAEIIEGITEIRPGTYIFMDAGQGAALDDYSRCAASILATVISKPTRERVVLDAGAKSLTSQNRAEGICATTGFGLVKASGKVRLSGLFDEHGLINDAAFSKTVEVGDKIEVIPNHICPACNLYDSALLVSKGKLLKEIQILCRGKVR